MSGLNSLFGSSQTPSQNPSASDSASPPSSQLIAQKSTGDLEVMQKAFQYANGLEKEAARVRRADTIMDVTAKQLGYTKFEGRTYLKISDAEDAPERTGRLYSMPSDPNPNNRLFIDDKTGVPSRQDQKKIDDYQSRKMEQSVSTDLK